MKSNIPSFLLEKPRLRFPEKTGKVSRPSFLEKGVRQFSKLIRTTYVQWETAKQEGFSQRLDARVKVLFLIFFLVIVSVKKDILPEVLIGAFVFLLAAASKLNLAGFYRRALFFGFVFGFLIALPSSLNIITQGEVMIPLCKLSRPYDFWIYHVPASIGMTREGLLSVALLTLRVVNSISLSFLVIYTTSFPEIIRALKIFKAPDAFLMVLTLTYKSIFIFAQGVEEMHLAKKGRTVGAAASDARTWAAGRMAILFRKTRIRCEEVFMAMQGRGFSGEIVIYAPAKFTVPDLFAGLFFFVIGLGFLLW
ncbi:MAG: hypothetical protein CO150_01790 [Nitrospirae bacterium CG_4_9_14_3_um_filter_53_35]|nr:MAG: hypothetical protein COT35_06945 [Nitrospirae bacterium CG08_land_8_20_14_0_20_52_24]PIV84804.1 MAG: hypothetical protein COW52_05625 [Nitrospirae bacterium CG17_big_fil_post_rev_8_21_14_2_50_50_9]PIW84517.1 MAG: hypothetical protein COZ95_09445 [Nitrospirae bacterium CG_4_8_14_3_um_filter_50_41]PIX84590.1 MAG: hypothetical protein COZ32_12885 [Nitrospirae bacterium CG_4_10_14_3_um_filter_53_41]PJA77273.1 MAG: hypothetical protein CO150_01790 [Nitrospirae bacterium CG_4_9_14_3_um_filter